jgi:hypothetical protein
MEVAPCEDSDRIDNPSRVSHSVPFCLIEDAWRGQGQALRRTWVMDVEWGMEAKNRSTWYELGRCLKWLRSKRELQN